MMYDHDSCQELEPACLPFEAYVSISEIIDFCGFYYLPFPWQINKIKGIFCYLDVE